jgi:hypothetical protein
MPPSLLGFTARAFSIFLSGADRKREKAKLDHYRDLKKMSYIKYTFLNVQFIR